jgi:hypothetical protein
MGSVSVWIEVRIESRFLSGSEVAIADDTGAKFTGPPPITQLYATDSYGRFLCALSVDLDPRILTGAIFAILNLKNGHLILFL